MLPTKVRYQTFEDSLSPKERQTLNKLVSQAVKRRSEAEPSVTRAHNAGEFITIDDFIGGLSPEELAVLDLMNPIHLTRWFTWGSGEELAR